MLYICNSERQQNRKFYAELDLFISTMNDRLQSMYILLFSRFDYLETCGIGKVQIELRTGTTEFSARFSFSQQNA